MTKGNALWRKSSRSVNAGECVEVAFLSGPVGVRDSKNSADQVLVFAPSTWAKFLASAKNGGFDPR